ncbi:unnamed protein product [Schistocephalus solidus]|uniref:F-box/kelch-repeat protein n=1 Tax=Schistocephalus solidus TaxID=70667 RepID=A0A183T610_SCHSO|nr:unnamed protein product [Schistocephalus solidus]
MALASSEIFEDGFPLFQSWTALNEIRLAVEIKDLAVEVGTLALTRLYVHICACGSARFPSCPQLGKRERFCGWRIAVTTGLLLEACCGVSGERSALARVGSPRRWTRSHAAAVVKTAGGGEGRTLLGVFGGGSKGGRLSSCEVYDVSRDRWFNLPAMREKRNAPAAACLPGDCRVFVFGGFKYSRFAPSIPPSCLASVEFCRLEADWVEATATSARTADFWRAAAPMRTARSDLAATFFSGPNHCCRWRELAEKLKRCGNVYAARRWQASRPVDRADWHDAVSNLLHSSHVHRRLAVQGTCGRYETYAIWKAVVINWYLGSMQQEPFFTLEDSRDQTCEHKKNDDDDYDDDDDDDDDARYAITTAYNRPSDFS